MSEPELDVVALANELPFAEPSRDQVEEMRTAVLATLVSAGRKRPATPRRMRRWVALAGALAAAATIALVVRDPDDDAPRRHATIHAVRAATYTRIGDAPDEIVRISDGVVHLDVTPLGAGERFRVITGDGEVEVRGTAFEVEAHLDRLLSVRVTHGRVEVRTHGTTRLLGPGEHWRAPSEITAAITPSPAPGVPPPSLPAPISPASVPPLPKMHAAPPIDHRAPPPVVPPKHPDHDAETAFRTGWELLVAGKPDEAATKFDRAVTIDPTSGVAEDAAYWRAVALERAHHGDAARRALETFLADFPRSSRVGEAAILLGRQLIDAGDLDGAAARFHAAESDRGAHVRADARAGLAEVARRRTKSP